MAAAGPTGWVLNREGEREKGKEEEREGEREREMAVHGGEYCI